MVGTVIVNTPGSGGNVTVNSQDLAVFDTTLKIEDGTISTDVVWSSDRIVSYVAGIGGVAIDDGNTATGTTWSSDKIATELAALNSGNITESTNLYFTEQRVLDSIIAGFASGAGTVVDTDNVLQAIQKLDGNVAANAAAIATNATDIANNTTAIGTATAAIPGTTTDLAEGSNLYFTDARAIAAPITGFASGAGVVAAADTVLQAIGKLDGNIGALSATVSGLTIPADTDDITEASNLYFTDARAIAAPVTGFTSGAGTVAATDSILQCVQKIDGNVAANTASINALSLTVGGITIPSTTDDITEASNLYFTDARAQAAVIDDTTIVDTNKSWSAQKIYTELSALIPPPLDTFVPGWAVYPSNSIEPVITNDATALATIAAVSIGPQTPTINGVTFDQSSADTADISVPAGAGWTGTNWQIQRASEAPSPPTFGNNTARLEVTAFVDLPDPSFGSIAGLADLTDSSIRRNAYITLSGLTVGQRYYVAFFFMTYPNSLTRATILEPSDGGDSVFFGVDGVNTIFQQGIRRYGFTATGTSISFLKASPDASGSYLNGFVCIQVP